MRNRHFFRTAAASLVAVALAASPSWAVQCMGNLTLDFSDGLLAPWFYTTLDAPCAAGTITASAGYVAISRPAGIGSNCANHANLLKDHLVCGDFDIQADFNLATFAVPPSGRWRFATMYASDSCSGDFVGIERLRAGNAGGCRPLADSYKIWMNTTDDCASTFVPSSQTQGKFRIARTGSAWNVYYWNGSAWVHARTFTAGTRPVRFTVYAGGNSLDAQEVRFDNIAITSASTLACGSEPPSSCNCLPTDAERQTWGSVKLLYR